MYEGMTSGSDATINQNLRPGMLVRAVNHAVVVPMLNEVTVTATVSARVPPKSTNSRLSGIEVPSPPATTCHTNDKGGTRAGSSTTPVAIHHPRLFRASCREDFSAEGVRGQVITRHRDRLLVWDQDGRVMTLVDAVRGHLVGEVSLPQVDRLLCTDEDAGEIFVTAAAGRLLRLVPRN